MGEVPKVYCHITGDSLSKIMYPAETVIRVADDYANEIVEREMADRQVGLRWVRITTEDSLPPEDTSPDPKKYFIRCQESDENRENPYMRCDYLSRAEIEGDCQGTDWYEWLDESAS